jgi:hypothetical protein
MGFFNFDPSQLADDELKRKVRLFRWIVFGGMGLAMVAFLYVRAQGWMTQDVRRIFFVFLALLFPFTIPMNRLHKEYFARKRSDRPEV